MTIQCNSILYIDTHHKLSSKLQFEKLLFIKDSCIIIANINSKKEKIQNLFTLFSHFTKASLYNLMCQFLH